MFEQLFADSGASLGDYVELVQLDPSVIFYWRDGSQLALSPDVESMVDTLAQFEPAAHVCYTLWLRDTGRRFRFVFDHLVTKNANTVLEWIAPVPKRDLLRLGIFRSLDRELGRYFRSERVRAALGSYAMYLGVHHINCQVRFPSFPMASYTMDSGTRRAVFMLLLKQYANVPKKWESTLSPMLLSSKY